jgi:curved DNA-binding protein CbpA
MPLNEAGQVFGLDNEELNRLSRRQVTRLFRRRALKCHPDQGGRPTEFIRLSEAYKAIMQSKK